MDRDDQILNYVQDRLSPQDRAAFEEAMARDAALSGEVALMQAVRGALAQEPKHDNSDAVWDRLSASMSPVPQPANMNSSPWAQLARYAAVAAIAVLAWQVVVPRSSGVPTGFTPATEGAGAFVLQVKFADSATFGDIGALLGPLGGTITDGPTALGLVRVSFADATSLQEAAVALDARSDLVELVVQQ
ncbi:hypothetical protein CEP88_09260 [Roseobacter denitrificans]|uniref:Zinc-finger domain-containing protein n=1 Tax=Roseobacter denitrificans (strain ATCC 33942 / OCh 114) TaxID=375451 RepID=Q160Z3_ROSDO|nr:hypothetical protein [Roseobacter denitrificans]ABG33450.1 hypothetical protein RD1_4000 [Roseobacter denitrificans OCh 114]AVL52768.1 hypothetical protein CEP88_09260 [Roseobacter denitrificans]SFG49461.1 hypothetical protein SAMN05443635_12410 [Roseobacter denitrificans OCh 114]